MTKINTFLRLLTDCFYDFYSFREVSYVGRVIRDLSGMDTPDVFLVTCTPMDHTHVMKMHSAPKLVLDDSSARYRVNCSFSLFFFLFFLFFSLTPGCYSDDRQCTPTQYIPM